MKSCLGILFILLTFAAIVGSGALLWYLSSTSEFSRTDSAGQNPPKAVPVR